MPHRMSTEDATSPSSRNSPPPLTRTLSRTPLLGNSLAGQGPQDEYRRCNLAQQPELSVVVDKVLSAWRHSG